MNTAALLSARRTSALLLLGSLCGLAGVGLFINVYYGGTQFLPGYLIWERSLVAVAAVALLLGFAQLAAALRTAGERRFSWIGLGTLGLGTVLTLVLEGSTIVTGQENGTQAGLSWMLLIWAFVVLTFLGQAAFGAALLQTALVPRWAGWLLIIWNLGWLAVIVVFSAGDPYYPVLFYLGPLVLGILLLRASVPRAYSPDQRPMPS
ncbi:MAG TPA: hypothetical protein VGP82_21285 [Ktedonobacterales bacterium]|jgi:hypothetical protein|nr:hypothetical protein [Ktedonobacterales bacterium]